MTHVGSMRDFTTVTESPGTAVSVEQLEMNFHRYHTVSQYCEGKEVLEVGCGAGQGLGYLARKARRVVGGDITERLLRAARSYYKTRIPLVQLDAQRLPFRDGSFDVVILFEAIYYLSDPESFIRESLRVLRDGGLLAISSVNKEWMDFNPSPFSVKYFSAAELKRMLSFHGLDVECYAAFSLPPRTVRNEAISRLKRGAVSLGLIPRTMEGKKLLKRIFFGKLYPLDGEVSEGMAPYVPADPVSGDSAVPGFKIIYAFGRKGRHQ